jgi:hypothetical protein
MLFIDGVNIDNRSIERVEEFKYLGATLTDQNSIQEEIKSRLTVGNACYYSVQNLLSFRLPLKILLILNLGFRSQGKSSRIWPKRCKVGLHKAKTDAWC